jgi:hypothetical protein
LRFPVVANAAPFIPHLSLLSPPRARSRRERQEPRPLRPRHRALRKSLVRMVEVGKANCARCGKPIAPNEPWDLRDDEGDPYRHTGPEHRHC